MKSLILLVSVFFSIAGIAQNVGIGTTTPIARLEVKGEGNNSSTNTLVLKNLIGDTLFRMRNDGRLGIGFNSSTYGRTVNIAGNGVNFYRVDSIFSGAIFPTDTSVVMWSDLGDRKYVILQPAWGNVGIGTYSPDAKLHVKGSVILGVDGTLISNVIKVTVNKNIASVAANSSSIETFTVTGANLGSTVSISPGTPLSDGLLISYARVSAANTVEVKFMNVSAAAINHGTIAFFITVID